MMAQHRPEVGAVEGMTGKRGKMPSRVLSKWWKEGEARDPRASPRFRILPRSGLVQLPLSCTSIPTADSHYGSDDRDALNLDHRDCGEQCGWRTAPIASNQFVENALF